MYATIDVRFTISIDEDKNADEGIATGFVIRSIYTFVPNTARFFSNRPNSEIQLIVT
jgi:hypothetical protein